MKKIKNMGYNEEIRNKVQNTLALIVPVLLINLITLILIAIGSNLEGMGYVIGMELSRSWLKTLIVSLLTGTLVSGGIALMLKYLSRYMRLFNWRALKKSGFTVVWVGVTIVATIIAFWLVTLGSVAGEIWNLWVKTFIALPTILIILALNCAIFLVIFVWAMVSKAKADKKKDEREVA